MNQKKIFVESEGNAWFERNSVSNGYFDPSIDLLKKYSADGSRVLEIGCADGRNLNVLKNCSCYGIDPSDKAINAGKSRYTDLNLSVGTADSLFFDDNFFDIIFIGFCFYLIDRELLFKVIAEVDRVLKNGGHLIIKDFDTPFPIKRKYHHRYGVYSYKQQYENIFLSHPIYTMVEKISFSHHGSSFVREINERLAVVVLYKDMESAYVEL